MKENFKNYLRAIAAILFLLIGGSLDANAADVETDKANWILQSADYKGNSFRLFERSEEAMAYIKNVKCQAIDGEESFTVDKVVFESFYSPNETQFYRMVVAGDNVGKMEAMDPTMVSRYHMYCERKAAKLAKAK